MNPSEPKMPEKPGIEDSPPFNDSGDFSNRDIIAVYDATISPNEKTFTITPSTERSINYHFPLTQLYPNVLQITGYGWTPNFWADIRITHPYPGSGIRCFDPRVIAILPANVGVSFFYPSLGVNANNSVVLEPDGYTKLFDELGGNIPGNANPFKAYFKNQVNRVWSDTGIIQETQRWNMNLSGFGGQLRYKLVVDISTNYPNPPQAGVDNAPEPVRINAEIGKGLTQLGGSADITVTLLDWQGRIGIGGVFVEAPDLVDGAYTLSFYSFAPIPYEYIYKGIIMNSRLAPAGHYRMLIAAWDAASRTYIYNEFPVEVSDIDNGSLIWAKSAGGTDDIDGSGIAKLSDNSIIVNGGFLGSVTFGEGEPNETVLTSGGMFIARYDPEGKLIYAKRAAFSSAFVDEKNIITLSDNTVVVTGRFRATATFGPGDTNETILTSAGGDDFFVARYNPDATIVWAKCAGGSSNDIGRGITALPDNSIVATGFFYGSATFGTGEPNQTVLGSAGDADVFVAQYNSDGTLAWAKRAGGTTADCGEKIATLSDNSTVVTGYFNGSAIFGPGDIHETRLTSAGSRDIFIARYNKYGSLTWAKRAGGPLYDNGYGITSISDNSCCITGHFNGSATFGPGETNETVLISWGNNDIFIGKYKQDGMLSWVKQAGGTNYEEGYCITSLSNGAVVTTGHFRGSAIFGAGEINETILTSFGEYDVFIARYHVNGTLEWAKRAGGTDSDDGYAVASLSDNSTALTGVYGVGASGGDSAIFGSGELNETILPAYGNTGFFIARFYP